MPNFFQKRNARIVKLIEARELSFDEIGKKFGISRQRVQQIGARANIVRGHVRIDEDKMWEALKLVRRGMPLTHAAEAVGLAKPRALSKALTYRGLYTPTQKSDVWSEDDKEFLRTHYKKPGWSATAIGRHIGRNRNEVIGQSRRLALSDPSYRKKAASRRNARRKQIAALRHKGLSHAAIARKPNMPPGSVSAEWHYIRRGQA